MVIEEGMKVARSEGQVRRRSSGQPVRLSVRCVGCPCASSAYIAVKLERIYKTICSVPNTSMTVIMLCCRWQVETHYVLCARLSCVRLGSLPVWEGWTAEATYVAVMMHL